MPLSMRVVLFEASRMGRCCSCCVRPEVEAVLRAFMGWRPEAQSYKAFRLAPGPRPEAEPARLLVPIVFTVEHVINFDAASIPL